MAWTGPINPYPIDKTEILEVRGFVCTDGTIKYIFVSSARLLSSTLLQSASLVLAVACLNDNRIASTHHQKAYDSR